MQIGRIIGSVDVVPRLLWPRMNQFVLLFTWTKVRTYTTPGLR